MRRTLAVAAVAVVAVLAGFILGEYELTWIVGPISGLVVGLLLAELLVAAGGGWHGLVAALVVAVAAAAALAWAGWIDSDEGVEPFPAPAAVGAAVAAVAGAVRSGGWLSGR